MKIKERWVSWEEFDALFPGLTSVYTIDFQRIGGLTPGSIPFADASGMLTEYNTAFFFDEANVRLGIGVGGPVCRTHIRLVTCADYAGVTAETVLLLENTPNVKLHLQAATTGTAYIDFCDDAFNAPAGRVAYDFANDWLEFGVATTEILRLRAGPTFDYAGTLTLNGIVAIAGTSINLRSNAEIRFYDNGNYVGFEAPALGADQIWVLPAVDGNANWVLITDGGGNLSFSAVGSGDVTAAANISDHAIVRGNGGIKGVQDSGILIDDANNVSGMGTLACGALITIGDATVKQAVSDCILHVETYDVTPTDYSQLQLRRSHHDTIDTLAETQDNDFLGLIYFLGVDSNVGWAAGARIEAIQDGAAGAVYVPTELKLYTYSATAKNTDQLVLASNGNVGIGTASPDRDLHVNGTIVAGDNSGGVTMALVGGIGIIYGLASDASNYNDLQLRTGASPIGMYINTSGNVGIGLIPTANMVGLSIEAGCLTLKERATPTADVNYGKIYTKNDNKLYCQTGDGVEHEIAFV